MLNSCLSSSANKDFSVFCSKIFHTLFLSFLKNSWVTPGERIEVNLIRNFTAQKNVENHFATGSSEVQRYCLLEVENNKTSTMFQTWTCLAVTEIWIKAWGFLCNWLNLMIRKKLQYVYWSACFFSPPFWSLHCVAVGLLVNWPVKAVCTRVADGALHLQRDRNIYDANVIKTSLKNDVFINHTISQMSSWTGHLIFASFTLFFIKNTLCILKGKLMWS